MGPYYKCDKCGKELEKEELYELSLYCENEDNEGYFIEVCKDCMDEIKEMFEIKPHSSVQFENYMTPEKFYTQMEYFKNIYENDKSTHHESMDKFMCDTLISLGYGDGVDVFKKTDKWYVF